MNKNCFLIPSLPPSDVLYDILNVSVYEYRMAIVINLFLLILIYKGGLESSYDDIFIVDHFFDQWNSSTATLMEEVCRS